MIPLILIILATNLIILGITKFKETRKENSYWVHLTVGLILILVGLVLLLLDIFCCDRFKDLTEYINISLISSLSLGGLITLASLSIYEKQSGWWLEIVGTILLIIAFIALFRPKPFSNVVQHAFLMTPAQISLILFGYFVGWAIFIMLTQITKSQPATPQEKDPLDDTKKDNPPKRETIWDRLLELIGSHKNIVMVSFLLLCILILVEPYLHRMLKRTTAVKTPVFEMQLYVDRKLEIAKIDPTSIQTAMKMVPKYDWIIIPVNNGRSLCEANIRKIDLDLSGKSGNSRAELEKNKQEWKNRKKQLDDFEKFLIHFKFNEKITRWEKMRERGIDRVIIRDEVRCFIYQIRKNIETEIQELGDIYGYRNCVNDINIRAARREFNLAEIGNSGFYPCVISLLENYTENVLYAIDNLEKQVDKKDGDKWNIYLISYYASLSILYGFNQKIIPHEISHERNCEYSEEHLDLLNTLSAEVNELIKIFTVREEDSDKIILEQLGNVLISIEMNSLFAKNALAFLYADAGVKEGLARRYIKTLQNWMDKKKETQIDMDKDPSFFFLDTVGWVKLKFAKNDEDLLEAMLSLEEAKHLVEKSKDKFLLRYFLPLVKNHHEEAKLAYQPGLIQ